MDLQKMKDIRIIKENIPTKTDKFKSFKMYKMYLSTQYKEIIKNTSIFLWKKRHMLILIKFKDLQTKLIIIIFQNTAILKNKIHIHLLTLRISIISK
jgi:hypothetical protein